MLVLDAAETRSALPWDGLVKALGDMFAKGCVMPVRHHHEVEVPGEADATLLLMPAWQPGAYIGVKMVSVFPGNQTRGLPAIHGSYLLSSGKTGELLAIVDGGELTARRTAAASALAARYLARPDARSMLMVGTGRLSANVIEAHASVRPIREVARSLALRIDVIGIIRAEQPTQQLINHTFGAPFWCSRAAAIDGGREGTSQLVHTPCQRWSSLGIGTVWRSTPAVRPGR